MSDRRRFALPLILSITAILPPILLHVSDWFYHIIGSQHPSHFLGLISFSILTTACALITMARSAGKRKRAFQVFAALLWMFLALSVADLILYQMTAPYTTPAGWRVSDPTLRFRYKPYVQWEGWFLGDQTHWDGREKRFVQYKMDRNGFRNATDLQSAEIVCVGDSFTVAGSTGDSAYPSILSRLTGYSVANLGRGSYSTQQELEVLRRYGVALNPRILVWQIFEGNDLQESASYEDWRNGKTRSALKEVHRDYKIAVKQILNRSIILRGLRRLLMPSRMQFGYEPMGSPVRVSQHPGWRLLKKSLTQGIALAKTQRIRTVLIFFPCKASLYKPKAQRPGMADLLRQFAKERGIDFVDMWEIYRMQYLQSGTINYWFNDSHISDDGCRLAAQILAQEILDK